MVRPLCELKMREAFVHPFLIISGNCISSRTYGFTGKIKILAETTGIKLLPYALGRPESFGKYLHLVIPA